MTTTKTPHPADTADLALIPTATKFIVSLFLGTGRYDKREKPTLKEAREEALKMAGVHGWPGGRKPLIYAVLPDGRDILVPDNVTATLVPNPAPAQPAPSKEQPTMTTQTSETAAKATKSAKATSVSAPVSKKSGKAAKKSAPAKKVSAGKKVPTKAAKAAKAEKLGKRAAIEAAAREGKLPDKPDFSAETHKRFRPKLDEVVALVKAGDIKGLKAYKINPVSTSPKAIARYRDLCVIALEAKKAA
jgi:hypothetical protein